MNRTEILETKGWKEYRIGQKYSHGKVKDIEDWEFWVRKRTIQQLYKGCIKNEKKEGKMTTLPLGLSLSQKGQPSETLINRAFSNDFLTGSNSPMGIPKKTLTPANSFSSIRSLQALRTGEESFVLAYDSEWVTEENVRKILSWQFACIHNGFVYEFIFIAKNNKELPLEISLACIMDFLGGFKSVDVRTLTRYKYCVDFNADGTPITIITKDVNEARNKCVFIYKNKKFEPIKIDSMPDKFVKRSNRDWAYFHKFYDYSICTPISVTLLCHTGKVDITTLGDTDYLLKYLTDVQGGIVSMQPKRIAPKSLIYNGNTYGKVYPISLSQRDTMCHAPAGKKSLKNLGEAIGIAKYDIPDETKEHMDLFLQDNPEEYFEYAATDSVVTLMYGSSIYGENQTLPVTITGGTAKVVRESMMAYLGCKTIDEFNRVYRGLERVKKGKLMMENKPGFIEASSLEPISDVARTIQNYASFAYHGGYNACSEVGYFDEMTYDYDLKNAYPTAMCFVPDIDWEQPVRTEIIRENLTLHHWTNPLVGFEPFVPFFGYIKFKFPEGTKYPCIPVNVEGVPVYPLTSEGLHGVYACGPEIYLALKMGAEIYCERGYFLNSLMLEDGRQSKSLAQAIVSIVQDRSLTEKGTLANNVLKTMVNSIYGKNAQNVVQKNTWEAYTNEMKDIGASAITNPVSACLTTSIVRAILIATITETDKQNYKAVSVTTDGFISNIPENILKSLDMFGMKRWVEQSRLFLTNGSSSEIWEVKHYQNDLINFTTRGNVSLLPHGVCAHNSTASPYPSDSYEDRKWLMTQVLSRTGAVATTKEKWTSFKDLVNGSSFYIQDITRMIREDFDMKRKPNRQTFKTDYPIVEGEEYEIAHFDTVPFTTIEEFKLYRQKKELVSVLRTQMDWNIFFQKIDYNANGAKIRDKEWAILFSCVIGYRAGLWDIPKLNQGTVEEKCEWLNTHNVSSKKFKISDWKNARRPERQVNMLPTEYLQEKLMELQADK